jgi:hypothetical protein
VGEKKDGMLSWLPEYDELLPNLDELVTEDGKAVDNLYVEKLYRLLTNLLYVSWVPPGGPGRPFLAASDVGWFHTGREAPVSPDVFVSLDVVPLDTATKEGRSYFEWLYGKSPDVCVEVVSDARGDEPGEKLRLYQRWGLPYYVNHDPLGVYDEGVLRAFELRGREYAPIDPRWIRQLGLGLTMWHGEFEGVTRDWLRWCDEDGVVLPTGQERAAAAEEENRRLLALLKAHGIDPKSGPPTPA